MRLVVVRNVFTPISTIGELTIDGVFTCYTLEDPVRETKMPGASAIPAGSYRVTVDYSARFRRPMPRLLDVPGFVGVRIHPGNIATDTSGCVLVGLGKGADRLVQSRQAFDRLFELITEAMKRDEVTIKLADVR